MRIWINNFSEVTIADLSATIRLTLKLDLDITGFPKFMVEEIKNNLFLKFHKEDSIKLSNPEKERTKSGPGGR